MNPNEQNHHYLDFLHCLVIQDHISFGGICKGPWRQCLIVYTLQTQTRFFVNFPLFFYLKSLNFLFLDLYPEPDTAIWKCAKTMQTVPQHCQQYSTPCFYCFYVCMSVFSLIAIFGKCTDNVISTSTLLTIVNTMSILRFCFYDYFFTNYHIWKSVHRPCKNYSNTVNNSLCYSVLHK